MATTVPEHCQFTLPLQHLVSCIWSTLFMLPCIIVFSLFFWWFNRQLEFHSQKCTCNKFCILFLPWCFESRKTNKADESIFSKIRIPKSCIAVYSLTMAHSSMAILKLNCLLTAWTGNLIFSQNLQCLRALQNGIANSEMVHLCPVKFYTTSLGFNFIFRKLQNSIKNSS